MKWVAPSAWLIGIGWCLAMPIVLGVLLGNWIDSRTGRAPLFVILGILIGLAVGIYGSVRMLLQFLAQTGGEVGKR
jgi:F0F1-type ATP synthase assembly protein I